MISYQEFLLILSKVLIIEASLHASTAENELQQYKFRNNILHETLIKEGCLYERVGKAKDMPEDEERVETQLGVEIILYEELTTRLIECWNEKQDTTATQSTELPTTTTLGPINYNINLALGKHYRWAHKKTFTHCTRPHMYMN